MAGRRWTQEEIDYLENAIGTFTVQSIARKLGRSFDAVNLKLNRLGLSGFEKSTDMLILNQVSLILGVERKTLLNKWKKNGLKIIRKGNYIAVHQDDLIKYMEKNPDHWNATSVTDDSLFMAYTWYKEKRRTDTKKQYFWTPDDVSKLKYLRHNGYSISEIADQMGRSPSSIKYKLYVGNRRN